MWKLDSRLLILASTNFKATVFSSSAPFAIIPNASAISSEYLSDEFSNSFSHPSVLSLIIANVSFNS